MARPAATISESAAVKTKSCRTWAPARDFDASGWVAMFAAAATPPAVLDRWNAEVTAILDLAEMRAGFVRAGMEADPRTRQEAREFHLGEIRKWGDAIRSANIKVE